MLGQGACGDLGEAGLFEHRSHAGAQCPPHIGQRRRRSGVRQVAETDVAHAGQRAVDASQHVGDADLGRGPGQRVSAVAATVATDQTVGTQVGEDVDEELRRNALRLGQIVGFDDGALLGGGELNHRADGVLSFGRHAHLANSAIRP